MKRFSSFIIFLLCVAIAQAQAPKGINYQGVARDNEGNPLASQAISVRIGILKNTAGGEVEYSETHKPQTNQFGLFTLVIGQGTKITGDFAFISWAVGTKWLQVEIDPAGGNTFTLAGSQQLMTVPYAFYAEYAGNGNSGLTAGQGISITGGVISNTGDADNNTSNELQNLSEVLNKSNNAGGLKITNLGAPVATTDAATKGYVDSQNAAQNLGSILTTGNDAGARQIKNLAAPTDANDAATKSYVDTQISNDLDKDPTNELQNIGQVLAKGNDAGGLKITNIGAPTAGGDAATKTYVDAQNALDLDINPTNELQNLGQVLTQGASANNAGGQKITNLGAPTINSDATTKLYVDNAIARNFAFKVKFDFTNTTGAVILTQTVPLSTEDIDLFNVIAINSFTAQDAGVYVFTVEGSYQYPSPSAPALYLVVNGIQNPIAIVSPVGGGDPKYNSTFMFNLTPGQTATMVMEFIPNTARFIGNFFGYKL